MCQLGAKSKHTRPLPFSSSSPSVFSFSSIFYLPHFHLPVPLQIPEWPVYLGAASRLQCGGLGHPHHVRRAAPSQGEPHSCGLHREDQQEVTDHHLWGHERLSSRRPLGLWHRWAVGGWLSIRIMCNNSYASRLTESRMILKWGNYVVRRHVINTVICRHSNMEQASYQWYSSPSPQSPLCHHHHQQVSSKAVSGLSSAYLSQGWRTYHVYSFLWICEADMGSESRWCTEKALSFAECLCLEAGCP